MVIREIRSNDAENFLRLRKQLDSETKFMLVEPGERTTTVDQQRTQTESVLNNGNSTILVAEEGGKLIGYLSAFGGRNIASML